jgi:alpha-D-xyloside xylohydrolase
LRALIFHHPDDKMCWHIDDEYYFGDDFLVAPVMNSEGVRDVYLPYGKWVDFFHGKIYYGGQILKDYAVKLEEIPLFVRCDAILPYYPKKVECTDDMDLRLTKTVKVEEGFAWEQLINQYL